MKKAKVSIIIPCYNAEKVIKPCLDSVIRQTHEDVEIIVVNDGSSDNTLKILREYQKKLGKSLILIDKKNAGQGAARNDGLKRATGEYIMFVDSDDILEPDYLEIMLSKMEEDKSDICISGYKNLDEKYNFISEVKYNDSFWTRFIVCVVWGKLFRTSFLRKYNLLFPDIVNGEDTAFSITAMSHTDNISIINNTGYGYYLNANSISRTLFKDGLKTINNNTNNYLIKNIDKDFLKKYKKEIWYFFIKYNAFSMLYSGKGATAEDFCAKNKELNDWMTKNIKLYRKKKLTTVFYPKGEKFSIKFIVASYSIINRLHLVKLFAKIYCKGKIQNGQNN